MLIENMRSDVEDMYPGEKWKKKVARMSDKQVIAIYHSNYDRKKQHEKKMKELGDYADAGLREGLKNPNPKVMAAVRQKANDILEECEQLSFNDILGGNHEKIH